MVIGNMDLIQNLYTYSAHNNGNGKNLAAGRLERAMYNIQSDGLAASSRLAIWVADLINSLQEALQDEKSTKENIDFVLKNLIAFSVLLRMIDAKEGMKFDTPEEILRDVGFIPSK